MNQQKVETERASSGDGGSGGIAAKSHEAAENLKGALSEQAEKVRVQAESAKEQTAERIRRVATHLRSMSETLRGDDPFVATVAERAGQGVEGVARYVSTADPQALIRDTEQLARRKPALFFGGAFLLGLAAGRFIKSSRSEAVGEQRHALRGEAQSRQAFPPSGAQRWDGPPEYLAGTPPRAASENRSPNEQRYRENYDATFARDSDEPRRSGADTTTGLGPASPPEAGKSARAPESNGGRQAGRGQTGKGSMP